MPLLGKKVFSLASNAQSEGTDDAPYLIPHTKERFQLKSEYKKRKELYSQNIWTCRATGHTNLTHEEAFKSEKVVMEQLASQFPKCYEKDVLEQVHHSTTSLEAIVDKAWWKLHQQLIVGEKVNLKVKVADKLIPAKVICIDSSAVDRISSSSMCNSPSSDKENSADEKDKGQSPKKWIPPKFLPFTYSIELENEAKVIHSVPAGDLHRVTKVPSKDMLRHFVRISALRSGTAATSPWVVNMDLVKQYKLINKFADFFLSPVKMSEAFNKAEENNKKRKPSIKPLSVAIKKLKLDKSLQKTKKDKPLLNDKMKNKLSLSQKKEKCAQNDSPTTPKKKNPSKKFPAPSNTKTGDVITVDDSDSEDNISLSKLKRSSSLVDTDSDSDVPLYQLVEQTTPKKKKKLNENGTDTTNKDIPLNKSVSSPKKTTPKKLVNGDTSKQTSPSSKSHKNKDKSVTKKVSNSNNKTDKKKGKKIVPQKRGGGGMKQVTLYDLTKKGKLEHKCSVTLTPLKTPPAKVPASPPKPPPTPAIVRRLISFKRETITDKMKFSNLLKKAIASLTPTQVKNLPDKLKDEFLHRKNLMEEKEKMAKMSPEEREAYLKTKREQAKKLQKQKMLQKLKDERRRFEDTDLELVPLPEPKIVQTPDGFPNNLFGDVAMVTEFINCYGGLLMPDSEYPIHTDPLMKALVGGSSGFTYISRVLTVLLQTLLQDEIAKAYKQLSTQMSDIAVNAYTASELVRLCLEYEDEEEGANEVRDVPEEFIKLLKSCEFYQLEVEQKLCLLRGLCSRVLATYSVQDYMEEQQRQASLLMKQKYSEMKQNAAKKKSNLNTTAEKAGSNEDKQASTENGNATNEDKQTAKVNGNKDGNMSISSFYGKETAEDNSGDDSSTWCSIVKKRRLLAAKAAAEKDKLEKEKTALREKELEEEKQREKQKKKQEQIANAINLARMVLRQEPIGTDRNHDRYWVFTNTTPGLYVEKGWVGAEISYCVKKQAKEDSDYEVTSESEDEEEDEPENNSKNGNDQTGVGQQKVVYRAKRHIIEKTIPHSGQNLWFTFRSQRDLDGLLKSLHPQGIRESLLLAEIKKNYDDIARAIIQFQRTNLELRVSDGDVEMMSSFKKELSDMDLRLRNGGLGGVADYEEWETRLMSATKISELGECLLQVKDGILDKFLQGFMKTVSKSGDIQSNENDEESENENGKTEDKEKHPEKEDKREKAIKEWRQTVEECQTMSRLHVLMAILDNCIKWEKSAENAKCKICCKKCDDARLLLCDECNQAFHMYCLRPALNKLPSGDWFCPACKPRRTQVMSAESESEDEEDKEVMCRVCRGREKLIVCSKCPAAYHTQCCDPPMRHPPRGTWECSDCKNGMNSRQRGKNARKASTKRNYRQEVTTSEDEDDDESDEEEEDEEDEDEYIPSRSKSSRNKKSPPENTSRKKQNSNNVGRPRRSRNSNQLDSSSHLTPPARSSRRGPSELSLCEDILLKVMKHKSCWPFLEPVDKKQIPDYYVLIKKPMDFQTMQKKCTRLSYASPQEFIEDAALVFENAETYNKPNSEVFTCMREVEKVFKDALHKQLPDWPYYRTVGEKDENSSGSDIGKRRSHNK